MSTKLDPSAVLAAIHEAAEKLNARRNTRLVLPKTLELSARLEELGVDSISIAEIVDDLEHKFEIELPFDELLLVESLKQFVDVICDCEASMLPGMGQDLY